MGEFTVLSAPPDSVYMAGFRGRERGRGMERARDAKGNGRRGRKIRGGKGERRGGKWNLGGVCVIGIRGIDAPDGTAPIRLKSTVQSE